MRAVTFLLAIGLLVPLTSLSAQQRLPIGPGARVRLTCPEVDMEGTKGTAIAVRRDTLVLRHDIRRPSGGSGWVDTDIPLASVTRLDVHLGRKSHERQGAYIGGMIGAGLGALMGAAVANGCIVSCQSPSADEQSQVAGAFLGGVTFGLIGGGVGALIRTDLWEEIPLDRLRVSFAPKRDGFSVGVWVAF